jgi:hypothetical protein
LTFPSATYSHQFAKLMNKMLQISEVAARGKEVEQRSWRRITEKSHGISSQAIFTSKPISDDDLKGLIAMTNAEKSGEDVSQNDTKSRKSSGEQMGRVIDPDDENPYTGGFSSLQRSIIAELLGQREELGRGPTTLDSVPVSALLQFRRALATMATDFPFGGDFGIAVR